MHELSIALNIVELAGEEAARGGYTRVQAVHLRLGRAAGVVKEALASAYELAREGSAVAESELKIEEVAVQIFCPRCKVERPAVSDVEPQCADCGTSSTQVVAGRELEVYALEVLE